MIENIQELWRVLLGQARTEWSETIHSELSVALADRGISINSRSGIDSGDYTSVWMCSKEECYIEIMASTTMGFSIKLIAASLNADYWPKESFSTYDRKNTGLDQLLSYLDTEPWKALN